MMDEYLTEPQFRDTDYRRGAGVCWWIREVVLPLTGLFGTLVGLLSFLW